MSVIDRPNDTRRFRLGDFVFDPASGELTRGDGDAAQAATRLAPKPSRLLMMLIERRGELLTQEEIRAALWSDVQVEFEQGVHFCVRQVRAALGDSAADPRYIETLPRRGYRLLVTPAPLDAPAGRPERPRRQRLMAALGAAAIITAAGGLIARSLAAPEPVRLAIMPLGPGDGPQIATHLLATLGDDPAFAVIGPSTTSRFAAGATPLADASRSLDVAYIVNARHADREGRPQMLVELVRTSDGAHVWVHWFDEADAIDAIADSIAGEVRRRLAP